MEMDNYEYIAYCQAAPLPVIARWGYDSNPTRIKTKNRKING